MDFEKRTRMLSSTTGRLMPLAEDEVKEWTAKVYGATSHLFVAIGHLVFAESAFVSVDETQLFTPRQSSRQDQLE